MYNCWGGLLSNLFTLQNICNDQAPSELVFVQKDGLFSCMRRNLVRAQFNNDKMKRRKGMRSAKARQILPFSTKLYLEMGCDYKSGINRISQEWPFGPKAVMGSQGKPKEQSTIIPSVKNEREVTSANSDGW